MGMLGPLLPRSLESMRGFLSAMSRMAEEVTSAMIEVACFSLKRFYGMMELLSPKSSEFHDYFRNNFRCVTYLGHGSVDRVARLHFFILKNSFFGKVLDLSSMEILKTTGEPAS